MPETMQLWDKSYLKSKRYVVPDCMGTQIAFDPLSRKNNSSKYISTGKEKICENYRGEK
jgi:hypothetical protein